MSENSTLTIALAVNPTGFDPPASTDTESVYITEQVFEHLVRYRPGTTEVEPALATRWEVSQDGTEWTFHLRPGVRFHDGSPLNADAVVASLERIRNPSHPFHLSAYEYWETTFSNIQRVEKVDPLAVRIVIDRPHAPFLANLAMFPAAIVSPKQLELRGEEFSRWPVGTGPFKFVEWVQGDRVVLEANREYWRGSAKMHRLVFRIVPDAEARRVGLEGGTYDVAHELDPEDLQFVPLHPELRVHRASGLAVSYLALNTRNEPLDDVEVRRALNHAINRDAIVKLIYQGRAKPATGPLPPTMWGHRASAGYVYDPEKARRLLRGVAGRLKRRPRLVVPGSPRLYLPSPKRVARMIARNLEDVGFPVEIEVVPWSQFLDRVFAGEHDMCLFGWIGDNGDPDNFLYELLDRDNAVPPKAKNVALYDSAELHGLLVWARESTDRAERERLYRRAQEVVERDAPWVPLAHSDLTVAVRRDVRGFVINPVATFDYWSVYKSAEGGRRAR